MLLISDVFILINYYSQILWLSVAACIVAQLWLRHKHPDMPRPIKTNLIIPVLFLIACAFLIIFPIPSQPFNTLIGALIVLSGKNVADYEIRQLQLVFLGIPVYYLCVTREQSKQYNMWSDGITKFLQRAMEITFPEEIEAMLSK